MYNRFKHIFIKDGKTSPREATVGYFVHIEYPGLSGEIVHLFVRQNKIAEVMDMLSNRDIVLLSKEHANAEGEISIAMLEGRKDNTDANI